MKLPAGEQSGTCLAEDQEVPDHTVTLPGRVGQTTLSCGCGPCCSFCTRKTYLFHGNMISQSLSCPHVISHRSFKKVLSLELMIRLKKRSMCIQGDMERYGVN